MATILIIGDRSASRRFLMTLLDDCGYRFLEASDGQEGLAAAHAGRPDVIIADVVMATMDGYEFARRVRADPTLIQTQVIFYTPSSVAAETRRLAQACGVSHIITRPAERKAIRDTVNVALTTRQILPALPAADEFHHEAMRLLAQTLINRVEALEAEIGERRRAEAVLAASEERFRALVENGSRAVAEPERANVERDQLLTQVEAGRRRLEALSVRLLEVQEVERRYIARELHDQIGQLLTGLSLFLEFDPRLPADAVRAKFDEARRLVGQLIDQVHTLSLDLRPAMLDDLGLLPALLWHFERYTTLTGVRVRFDHQGLERRRFIANIETALYRVVQEALTNVARHAQVSAVRVFVQADEAALSAQIEDAGVGFDFQATEAAHVSSGLSGMRERAALLGGQLSIESAPGNGTQLTLILPLAARLERRRTRRPA